MPIFINQSVIILWNFNQKKSFNKREFKSDIRFA